ncbi:MAG TPA: hypothetical protein VHU81_17435 [Thermoanaerobaculia bacterium]|jgi:type II secretory pathway component GspD/PulD (secretin)|nr:hypothetical protein [Thermoanaerobaculia bacterium]
MRYLGRFLALSCLALAPAAVWAETDLGAKIALKVEKADPQEVLKTFGQIMSVPVDVDPTLRQPVSIRLEQVTVRTALNAVCESVGCDWRLEGGKLKVTAQPKAPAEPSSPPSLEKPIDIKITDANLREVLATVAQILSYDLALDPAIQGKITLSIENQGLRSVLDTICAQAACRWRVIEGSRTVLEVKPK